MKKLIPIYILLSVLFSPKVPAQYNDFCKLATKNVFNNGEELTFNVFYTVWGAWVGAGQAVFTTTSTQYGGKDVFHIVGNGKTYSSYDWIFKVRDRYETYIDVDNKVPLRFKRDVKEGNTAFKNDVTFNHTSNKAVSNNKSFNIEKCTQDVLSTIYFARNIDYSKYAVGAKIPFSLFLDDELHNLYIKYMGKVQVKTKYGTYRAIKIQPLLVEGTIFKGGDKMVVYVSDDENHIPLRIETPILVGDIKVDLASYKNLKYPMTAKIK